MTADRVLFNVLWTSWMILGMYLEERDLVAEFGVAYREYQQAVPRLIPWRFLARVWRIHARENYS
jgi:protein-S-isoprenylcysteine O-methyltransferase Ste14